MGASHMITAADCDFAAPATCASETVPALAKSQTAAGEGSLTPPIPAASLRSIPSRQRTAPLARSFIPLRSTLGTYRRQAEMNRIMSRLMQLP
jgi:hypothetical protein